jgi:predicted transposase
LKQVLTIVGKLKPSIELIQKIEATLKAFADACNFANSQVKPNITSKTTIQNLVYQTLREKFGLSANLAVRACARVGANRKTAKLNNKPVKKFAPTSADYDARIFAYREKDESVSLTLLGGRFHIPILSNPCLSPKEGNGRTSCRGLLGRQPLSKGTRSSRRRCRKLVKLLSMRERRFQKWVNHNISKTIISQALKSNALVAIEDLTGIRDRTLTGRQPPESIYDKGLIRFRNSIKISVKLT